MADTRDDEMTRMTVRLPKKLLQRLKRIAADEKRSVNNEVVWMLDAAAKVAEETST